MESHNWLAILGIVQWAWSGGSLGLQKFNATNNGCKADDDGRENRTPHHLKGAVGGGNRPRRSWGGLMAGLDDDNVGFRWVERTNKEEGSGVVGMNVKQDIIRLDDSAGCTPTCRIIATDYLFFSPLFLHQFLSIDGFFGFGFHLPCFKGRP